MNPQAVASPAQVRAILAEVARLRPELTAFFGCLYYAALRPEEAVALRRTNLILPAHPRGKLVLTEACPRTGSARTSTGTPHEPRGLKHRPDGAVRAVPIPPVLADLLRPHLRQFGPAPDGRLFRGARGGILSESTYGRIWRAARQIALGRQLAATPLARRPYDLRHAALSFVAERHQRTRRGHRPRGHQRARAARRLRALHRRAGTTSSASRSKTPSTRTPAPYTCHNA